MNREKKLIIALAGYLTLVCCVILVFPIRPPGQHINIGLAIGSLFGFTILPSIWIVFGPGHRMVRWPLAGLMLVAVPMSLSFYVGREIGQIVLCQIAITVFLLLLAALLRFQFAIRLLKPNEPTTMEHRVLLVNMAFDT